MKNKKTTYSPKVYKLVAICYFVLCGGIFIKFMRNYLVNGVYSSILYSVPIMLGCLIVGGYLLKKGSNLKADNT